MTTVDNPESQYMHGANAAEQEPFSLLSAGIPASEKSLLCEVL